MATSVKTSVRPAARLDASLLLARKGEASPTIAATQHNNPGLAWGADPHPEDFQGSAAKVAAQPQPVLRGAKHKPAATARLRSESFFIGRAPKATPASKPERQNQQSSDDVTLSVRLEDETYLRLKYLAQKTGMSSQKILQDALGIHLVRKGVPRTRKIQLNTK